MLLRPIRISVLTSLLVALLAPAAVCGEQATRAPDATITVSSSPVASALGFSLVEGTLRYRDKVYQLALRGAQPTAGCIGKVYDLGQPRNIEGIYKPTPLGLRSDRGVVIVFEPPLDLSAAQLQIDLGSRRYPKASSGQRGTID